MATERLITPIFDTLTYATGATLVSTDIFTNDAKDKAYRNVSFTSIPSSIDYKLMACVMETNIVFNGADADANAVLMNKFLHHSYIEYQFNGDVYPIIPLSSMANFTLVPTGHGTYIYEKKNRDGNTLQNGIVLPKGGDVRFTFVPASGLTLGATGGASLANITPNAYYIKFRFVAEVQRPAHSS